MLGRPGAAADAGSPPSSSARSGVIAQEIAEAADTPDDLVFELAQGSAFAGQPLGRPILGSVEVAGGRPRRDTLEAFRASLYAAPGLVVSASGAVDEDELLAAGRGGVRRSRRRRCARTPEPAALHRRAEEQGRARWSSATWSSCCPPRARASRDYFAQRIFAEALGGGMASRLFQEAREKRGLAYSIDAYSETYADTGVLGVYAGCARRGRRGAGRGLRRAGARRWPRRSSPASSPAPRPSSRPTCSWRWRARWPAPRGIAGQVLLFGRPLSPQEMAGGIDDVSSADIRAFGERMLSQRLCAGAVLGPKRALGAAQAFERSLFEGG